MATKLSRQNRDKKRVKKKRGRQKPRIVKEGSSVVKIYEGKDKGYQVFWVVYYEGKARVRKRCPSLETAEAVAREAACRLQSGEAEMLSLSKADKEELVHARIAIEHLKIPLHVAAQEYAKCCEILDGVSPLLAANFFKKHHSQKIMAKPVDEIVAEFIAAKKAKGRSKRYCDTLRLDLAPFAASFQTNITSILTSTMDTWLGGLKVSPRTQNNIRCSIITLFNYAKSHGYLPKDQITEADMIEKATEKPLPIGTFTPDEMKMLLQDINIDVVPFVVLGGFAGIRHEEILRMDWSAIKWKEKHIDLPREITKNKRRRIIPIQKNLMRWLSTYRARSGKVCRWRHTQDKCRVTAIKLGITWKQNALRHSYASYRLAIIKNEHQIALEMGNSPAVIRQHYDQVVTPQESKKWWTIKPKNH